MRRQRQRDHSGPHNRPDQRSRPDLRNRNASRHDRNNRALVRNRSGPRCNSGPRNRREHRHGHRSHRSGHSRRDRNREGDEIMACGGCMGARSQFVTSYRAGNYRGMASAVRQGIQINVDKARQMYRQSQQPANKATPYRRPPERTT